MTTKDYIATIKVKMVVLQQDEYVSLIYVEY